MLIFHKFKDMVRAEGFCAGVRSQYNLEATVYDNQDDSDLVDQFPFELTPPIVLVERTEYGIESELELVAMAFHGEFAGT